jgi:eukaryotic-like serine/threonine-protein kinase
VDEQASSFGDEEKVTAQKPEGGARPGVGTSVAITVGTGPSSVGVPQLYGNTPAQARSILGEANLKLGDKSSEYNGDVAEGSIFFQDPAEGQRVEPGTAVDVTVSLGAQQIEVPEVYGLSVADAQATLSGVGLNSTTFEVEGDEAAGTALSTDPSVGAMVDPGSTVTLYYSAGPPPVTTSPAASSSPAAMAPPKTQTQPEDQAQPQDQAQPKPQAQPEATPKPQAQPNQGAQGGGTGNAKPSKATKPPGGSQDSGSGGGGNGGSSAGNSGSGGGGNVGGGSGRTGGGTRVQASKASGSGTGK